MSLFMWKKRKRPEKNTDRPVPLVIGTGDGPVSDSNHIIIDTKYRLTRKIASGGMGSIYEAEQIGAEGFVKRVAIKLLRKELSENDQFVNMFIGEGSWGAHPRANDDDKSWTMQSASFNQAKWVHVRPQQGDVPPSLEVFTVITGEYDEDEEQILYVDQVENLTEDDIFKIPANIRLYKGKYGETSVKYPFYLNQGLSGTQ